MSVITKTRAVYALTFVGAVIGCATLGWFIGKAVNNMQLPEVMGADIP